NAGSRAPSAQPPGTPTHTRKRPRRALLLAAIVIALLSLLLAIAVDPRAFLALLLALPLGGAAFFFPESGAVSGSSRVEIDRQLAEQERARQHDELERTRQRLEHLNARSQAWLTAANEPDLASLIARLEQQQRAIITLENTPAASADEIALLQTEQQDCLTKMALTQQRIEQLQSERPELLTLTPEVVAQHRQTIERLDAQVEELDQVLRTNEIRRGVLSQTAVDDAAVLRVALHENEAEFARVEQLAEALELAIDTLRECVRSFQENALDPVGDAAGRLLRQITGGRHQSVRLDQQTMEPAVRIGARDDVEVAALSRGTRDQLYLAIRLALVDALSGGITLPLIFDDPCVHFDAERLATTAQLLSEIARERTVILLTKDEAYTRWFAPSLRLHPPARVVPNGVSS
ncbi:MAG TPA: hypothetical protein VF201_04220, partial [Nitrolancea sp.]